MTPNHRGDAGDLERELPEVTADAPMLIDFDGVCWWCRSRPADTGEHKYKQSDLSELMGDDDQLYWGQDGGSQLRPIRGKSGITRDRYRVVKFPKSLCGDCNNRRSQPLDQSYQLYSTYVRTQPGVADRDGVDFRAIYGRDWPQRVPDLARYHAKHFGCRLVRDRVPVPPSLRAFLDGAADMPDAHMALVTSRDVRETFGEGLRMSPALVSASTDFTRLDAVLVATYVGPIGVRYEWRAAGLPDRDQFFHHPEPVINRFETEEDVLLARAATSM